MRDWRPAHPDAQEDDVPLAQTAATHAATGLPPIGFGLVAFAILVGLLALTVAFRNAGNRN